MMIASIRNVHGCNPPTSNFSVDNTTPVVNETINFTDASSNNPDGWNWTFTGGTPATSTVQNPSVSYSTSGYKTVSLRASNIWGTGNTETKTNYINVGIAPTAGSIGSNQTICNGDTPALLTSVTDGGGTGVTGYEWQTNASGSYVTISGAIAATYQPPALTATTSYRRRTVAVHGITRYSAYTTAVTITVQSAVGAGVIATDQTICSGGTPLALTSTTGGSGSGTISYEWQTDASGSYVTISGETSSGYQPPAITASTNYRRRTVSLLSGINCYSSYTTPVAITVVAQPAAPSITKDPFDAIVCPGQTLTINSASGTGGTGTITDEYRYSTDDGSNWSSWSNSISGFSSVTGVNWYESRRTATGTGCNTSLSNQVSWIVNPTPIAVISFPPDGSSDCPQLSSDQGFNAETGQLGYTIVTFTVDRPVGASTWDIDYMITGTNATTYAGSPNPLGTTVSATGISSSEYEIEIWIKNIETTTVTLTLTVDKIWDSIGCLNDSDVSLQVVILPLPAIGTFN